MREIRFRGKRDNGEWVYGSLILNALSLCSTGLLNGGITINNRKYFTAILNKFDNLYQVDPNTVGQFTGLKDKKGQEICEGDVIALGSDWEKAKCEVTFRDGCFCIIAPWLVNNSLYAGDPTVELKTYCNRVFNEYLEIISNIHDNPELLESVRI